MIKVQHKLLSDAETDVPTLRWGLKLDTYDEPVLYCKTDDGTEYSILSITKQGLLYTYAGICGSGLETDGSSEQRIKLLG